MRIQAVGNPIDTGPLSRPKLFVVGCPRSGTAWVTSLITGHPQVLAVPRETHAYQLVYEPFVELPRWNWQMRLRSWRRILRFYGLRPLLLGFRPRDIWPGILREYQRLERLDRPGLHGLVTYQELQQLAAAIRREVPDTNQGLLQAEELIAAMFARFFARHGQPGQTMLENTPLHIRYGEQILWRFPGARMIEVVRDGRDVCASYRALADLSAKGASAQQTHRTPLDTAGAIRQWKQYVEWGERLRKRHGLRARVHTVRYEALMADPERCLRQMFMFANLKWNEEQVEALVAAAAINRLQQPGSGSVGDWRDMLSAADIDLCHQIAGEPLARLGYRTHRP